ncbi:MAG TPA: MmcQ/YjbR family DNA-binding protein [Gaiellaceae bacterium]|nr:MmcQ/YjbR family DNA-binding protein [Gaiellaceae bacterium]
MATMADLDELALGMPQATKEVSEDGRPSYLVHGKMFCFHRGPRRDAVDPQTGERLEDVLMFRVEDLDVKELLLADDRGVFFTTPHFDGYSAILMRIPNLARLERDELHDLVAEAWLTRAQKRVAKAWLGEQEVESEP